MKFILLLDLVLDDDNKLQHFISRGANKGCGAKTVKIIFLNAHGNLDRKFHPGSRWSRIVNREKPDLFAIVEHMKKKNDIPSFEGFKLYSIPASSRNKLGRGSGGVVIGVREILSPSVSKLNRWHSNVMWIEVGSGEGRHIAVGVVYSRTSESKYAHEVDDMYEFLIQSVCELRVTHDVIVMGDFNARTGQMVGDTATNENGPKFIDFVQACGLEILNRTHLFGKPTFVVHQKKGTKTSIVDYLLVDSRLAGVGTTARLITEDVGSDHRALVVQVVTKTELTCFVRSGRGIAG